MTTACKLKSVSALVPLTATKDINYFTNKPYAVINVHHRDKQHITPTRTGLQPGDTVEFELPKTFDYYGRLQLQSSFLPYASPAPVVGGNVADACFVDGAGRRLIENVTICFTNKRLTSSTVPYWWAVLLNKFCRDTSYRTYNRENHLENQTQTQRNQALTNGYTFTSEIESGYQHHSRENYVMISVLSSRLNIKIKLASKYALLQGFSGDPTGMPNPWIATNGLELIVNSLHLNPHERIGELDKHEEGIFNLIRVFTVQQDVIPAGSTSYTLDLKMTSAYEVIFFIFKPTHTLREPIGANRANDPVSVLDATGAHPRYWSTVNPTPAVAGSIGYSVPVYRLNNANVNSSTAYSIPQEWEFRLQNNPIVNREKVWHNLTVDRSHHFPGSVEAPNGIICLHLSETFQHDNNAILGHMDFNTASQRQAMFYWTNGSVSSLTNTNLAPFPTGTLEASETVNDTMTVITIACGPDFVETIQGQAHAVFGI